jgi:hypothetical protein
LPAILLGDENALANRGTPAEKLPPLLTMNVIHIADAQGQQSSYDLEAARQLWNEGRISPDSHYWQPGMPDWRPAIEFFNPAALPAGLAPAPGFSTQMQRGFVKDPTGLTKFLIVLLWTYLTLSAVSAAITAVALATGQAVNTDTDTLSTYDIATLLILVPQLPVVITTGVVFLMWIHRANRNARGLGAEEMTFSPGWSVGWFFIPIANFWKPYQAMKQIWQASANPSDWQSQPVPTLVSNWWALWVFSNLLSQAALRLTLRAETSNELLVSEIVNLVCELVDIPLCLVAMQLVRQIIRLQSHWTTQPTST